MIESTSGLQNLIDQASQGDGEARQELLERYRDNLRRMVASRLDRRLTSRIDPSDVVQESLADASRRMDVYLKDRAIPFLGWLRQLAGERIIDMHRRHILAQRRSITREIRGSTVPDDSEGVLVRRLMASDTSPSNRMSRQELRDQVTKALAILSPRDREVLVMRYIEQVSTFEIGEALGITEGAVKARVLRALVRMRGRVGG
jgi:RNA polymerase sigma-70 factor (ECF subfamily)